MVLFEGKKDANYNVKELLLEDSVTRRLQALGLNEGTRIKILNRKRNGAMIVQVRGTRLALGKHIASGIEVKEVQV